MPPSSSLRALIVDGDPESASLLASALDLRSGGEITVTEVTGDPGRAMTVVSTQDLEVVLLDPASEPLGDPTVLIGRLHVIDPRLPMLLVSSRSDADLALACLAAGAIGFVPKHGDASALVSSVRVAARGGAVVPPALLRRLLELRPAAVIELELTDDDVELWKLVVSGETMETIAERRHVSVRTAKRQVSRLYDKLGVPGRLGAAELAGRIALEHG